MEKRKKKIKKTNHKKRIMVMTLFMKYRRVQITQRKQNNWVSYLIQKKAMKMIFYKLKREGSKLILLQK